MNDTNYWFYVYPNIYVEQVHREKMMLYNTDTGAVLHSANLVFNDWVREVHIAENLGVISVSEEAVETCDKELLEDAIKKKLVNLQPIASHPLKPVNFLPILNLQKDIENIDDEATELMGDDIISYLSELNIFLSLDDGLLEEWDLILRQLLFPIRGSIGQCKQLDPFIIELLLRDSQYSIMQHVNFVGGNLAQYSYWGKLRNILSSFPQYNYHLWFAYTELEQITGLYASDFFYDIIIVPCFIDDMEEVKDRIMHLSIRPEKVTLHVYVTSEEEYVASVFPDNYSVCIRPLYTGHNLDFFKKNVFLKEEDILGSVIGMRKIFCNQKLNSTFFGVLNVYPDGSVRATNDTAVLGNLCQDDIKSIVYRELSANTAWRQIRNSTICDACCYQYLCPPPGIYERILERDNLCDLI